MPLITRISRLFKADFNAVLDNIEEPELLLHQAIREMEDEVVSNQQQLKWLNHEVSELNARRDELGQKIQRLNEELDLCFESGKDDLARGLVKRKLEAQRFEQAICNRCETTAQSVEELRTRIAERSSSLESMRQKAELFASATDSTNVDGAAGDWVGQPGRISDDEVEIALLRERQQRSES
ncbi:MAG: PspA/IM30 family protein [Gammaproteobacteria bacterium]